MEQQVKTCDIEAGVCDMYLGTRIVCNAYSIVLGKVEPSNKLALEFNLCFNLEFIMYLRYIYTYVRLNLPSKDSVPHIF